MPIILNGTGTISGLTAGGLPSSSVTTANIADNAVTFAKIGTTEQGQLCKAWVNFNGTSTVAIRASYNVSSITDTAVGRYTVNYGTALTDANYSLVATTNADTRVVSISSLTTSGGAIRATNTAGALEDQSEICVAIFR